MFVTGRVESQFGGSLFSSLIGVVDVSQGAPDFDKEKKNVPFVFTFVDYILYSKYSQVTCTKSRDRTR